MKNNKFIFKNNIYPKYLNKKLLNKFNKKYSKIEKEVSALIDEPENVYNILSGNFRLSFKIRDLEKFKKYRNIAIIGMGGSILGSQAIFKFLENKIKKNLFFFDNIDYEKALNFKKKINKKSVLFIIISKSGSTIETISNFFFINKIKKDQKNLILISEKKIMHYLKYQKNLIYFMLSINISLGEDIQFCLKLVFYRLILWG